MSAHYKGGPKQPLKPITPEPFVSKGIGTGGVRAPLSSLALDKKRRESKYLQPTRDRMSLDSEPEV